MSETDRSHSLVPGREGGIRILTGLGVISRHQSLDLATELPGAELTCTVARQKYWDEKWGWSVKQKRKCQERMKIHSTPTLHTARGLSQKTQCSHCHITKARGHTHQARISVLEKILNKGQSTARCDSACLDHQHQGSGCRRITNLRPAQATLQDFFI